MFKLIGGIGACVLILSAAVMLGGCSDAFTSEYIVGKDIAQKDIKDFYYTINASTNPPYFQRFRFTNKEGKYTFYHEKREGDVWPLREEHITVHGTVELSTQEWNDFFDLIKDGKVTKRKENYAGGGRGPWMYLYWTKDKDKYQVFNFANRAKKEDFEKLCEELKGRK